MDDMKQEERTFSLESSSDDRLWAALSWIPISPLWPVISILVLLVDDYQDREFVRYHAIVSLATGLVLIPLSIISCGLAAILYLVFFWWAYRAYKGERVHIPVVSDWVVNQGWVTAG